MRFLTYNTWTSHEHHTHSYNPLGAKKASTGGNEKEDDTVEDLAMSPEDAEDALGALEIDGWTDTIQAAMNSPNWQLKSDAVLAIGEKIAVRLTFLLLLWYFNHAGNEFWLNPLSLHLNLHLSLSLSTFPFSLSLSLSLFITHYYFLRVLSSVEYALPL